MDMMRCPVCQSITWEDLHALDPNVPTHFRCIRCGRIASLGCCKACGQKDWIRRSELFEKASKRPIVRYQCGTCGRMIGMYLDSELSKFKRTFLRKL
ncbi:MAG: hypothetical protein N2442_14750 [Spirochaetes bacterium]|nr:hypothetical protein [Spirochaetota bacterium]